MGKNDNNAGRPNAGLDTDELALKALLDEGLPDKSGLRELIGETIGNTYTIIEQLGAGGMGEVYLADHARTGGRVALKFIKPSRSTDDRFLRRFESEARNTARLHHPNIVRVFDYGQRDDLVYIAMEFVEGRTLAELISEHGRLAPKDAVRIAEQVLLALDSAHSAGIIHRDIKPPNILVQGDGRDRFVKVLDFGIATALENGTGQSDGPIGTPQTMAPEQFQGGEASAASDLYALGCTMHMMLSGHAPFSGTYVQLATQHTTRPAPRLKDVPDGLADWVLTLLEKAPANRPASARNALDELRRLDRPAPTISHDHDAFIGRQDELAQLSALLESSPVVTITGEGGLGKTRLAREWAARGSQATAWCNLIAARTSDDVLFSFGHALDVPLNQQDAAAQISQILARRDVVMIVDNCEQVIESLRPMLERWMRDAPHVGWVLTSRVSIGIVGESALRLAPLGEAARELFEARAREANPVWTCPEDESEALDELLVELDGLPLAIELAAARTRILSPLKMLERLDRRFELLRTARKTGHGAALRETIDWSWCLLDESAQQALAQLSVFEGGFDVDDAEALVRFADDAEQPFVLDALDALLDASLLRTTEDRFSTAVSIQAFAREKLAERDQLDATQLRHAAHMSRWGHLARIEEVVRGTAKRMIVDRKNLEAATMFALSGAEHTEPALGVRCLGALACVFALTGPFAVAGRLLTLVEPHLGLDPDADHLAIGFIGFIVFCAGDLAQADELFVRAYEMAVQAGSRAGERGWLAARGLGLTHSRRHEEAREAMERSYAISVETNDLAGQGLALTQLGDNFRFMGDYARARECLGAAIEILREIGDRRIEARALNNLALVEDREGFADLFQVYSDQALAINRSLGVRLGEGLLLGNKAWVAFRNNDLATARQLAEESVDVAREIGDLRGEVSRTFLLGQISLAEGDWTTGAALFREALPAARRIADPVEPDILASLGICAFHLDDANSAEQLLDEVHERWPETPSAKELATLLKH